MRPLVLSSMFNDAENMITVSHTCKTSTCGVSSKGTTNTALDSITSSGQHVQQHTTLTAVSCCILSSRMMCCLMSTSAGPMAQPWLTVPHVPGQASPTMYSTDVLWYSSKLDDVRCHVQWVYCHQTCTTSCPFQRVAAMAQPSGACPSSEFIWNAAPMTSFLAYASFSEFNSASTATHVPSSDYRAETALATMGGVKPAVSRQCQTTPYHYIFFFSLAFILIFSFLFFFWAFGFGLGFVLGLLLSCVFYINTRWKFKLLPKRIF